MKKVEVKDLKPGFYWLKDRNTGSLDPVRVYVGFAEQLRYLALSYDGPTHVKDDDQFFEMVVPTEGQVTVFSKRYGGEDINDLERDVSEAFDPDYNPTAAVVTKDKHGFVDGKVVVTMIWVPDNEQ